MIKITNLTIKNFLSVGNVTQAVRLDENGLTLVLGANTDSNGARNGAGKSTMLQAISFALFGKPLTRIKIPNLINNINGKGMLVTIDFERDGKLYRIERGKKPDVMKLYVNDTEQKTETDDAQGENRHTQEEIERLLGMSHTMFKHIVALNTFTDPFLKMSAADQRGVIEELLGVTQISQRADMLKRLIVNTKESMRDQEAVIKATTEANERIKTAVERVLQSATAWDVAHQQRLQTLAAELVELEALDFDAEIALFDALDRWSADERDLTGKIDAAKREMNFFEREAQALESEATRLRTAAQRGVQDQIDRLSADAKRTRLLIERLAKTEAQHAAALEAVQADIAKADGSSCVCCGQKLEGTDHLKTVVDNLNQKAAALMLDIAREQREAADLQKEVDAIMAEADAVRESDAALREDLETQARAKLDEAGRVRDRLLDHANAVDAALHARNALGPKPKPSFRSRDEAYRARQAREKLEGDIAAEMQAENPHLNEAANLAKAIQPVDYDRLNDLTTLFKHQDFLLKLLSNKDSFIRKKIIDQNLSYLNSRLNHYLDKLGLPHEVQFKSDLTVDIVLLGKDMDFEQLSRGEMNRVILATSWSFRDMWESMNTGCNLLWVDELIDNGTDGSGAEAALSVLKGMARDRGKNVFLISHREELVGRIDRTLLVRKENGFTTIEDGSQ